MDDTLEKEIERVEKMHDQGLITDAERASEIRYLRREASLWSSDGDDE